MLQNVLISGLGSKLPVVVIGSVEVISAFSEEENFLEQSNKEIDETSSNALLDKKDLMEVAEREANGEQSVVMSTRN
ncbi:hypothetical protein Tco_1001594 [Tanacetum coccineum]